MDTEQYAVILHRAFGSPSVRFGPFPTYEDAMSWCTERQIQGMIVALNPPDTDTGPFSEVWM